MYYRHFLSACAVIAATAGMAAPAMAVPTTYDLTVSGGGGFPSGPYGTVQLTQDGSNVDVLVTLSAHMGFVDTGSHQAFDFYLATPGAPPAPISPITITGLPSGWTAENTAAGSTTGGSHMNDFAGTFNYALDCSTAACGNGGNHPDTSPLSFTVDNVVIADFLPNGNGYYFAADICGSVDVDHSCNSGANTGTVAAPGTSTPVPEPLTLSLFGAGLAGVVAMRRRRKA